jgi:hypothetical protein
MATAKENRSLLSRFITFICCVSCCKTEAVDDELVITRVYQSKSLTELNERKREIISPEASKSEIAAADIEKSMHKQKKRKRRFWN